MVTQIDLGWQKQAACRHIPDGYTPKTWMDQFYPPSTGGRMHDGGGHYPVARPVCNACPVRTECLENAIATEGTHPHGMRGGLSERDRVAEVRRRRLIGRAA
jgi:hypothetical protein